MWPNQQNAKEFVFTKEGETKIFVQSQQQKQLNKVWQIALAVFLLNFEQLSCILFCIIFRLCTFFFG